MAVVALVLGLVARPWVRIYTGAAPPEQFDRRLTARPDVGNRHVLAVGHNAGNNPATAAAALAHGADVIEIDVMAVDGRLATGRPYALRWLEDLLFSGASLTDAWRYTATARMTQLDLQENDRQLLDEVVAFLRHVPVSRHVMVSTRDPGAIRYLRPRLSNAVTLLLSVPFPEAVARVQGDAALGDLIGGITVYAGLVSEQLKPLLASGVDGVTTNNLAVIDALAR